MVTQTTYPPYGEIVASNVPVDVYINQYAEHFYEWVQGNVIKISPVSNRHNLLSRYLELFLLTYFNEKPIGDIRTAPFMMRLPESRREPDIQVLVGDSLARINDTYTDGPADIAIEIVSPGTPKIDYGEKLEEYERGGVTEYWLIDPLRQEAVFRRLGTNGLYPQVTPTNAIYQTPLLPELQIHVPTLWVDPLPSLGDVLATVRTMLDDNI